MKYFRQINNRTLLLWSLLLSFSLLCAQEMNLHTHDFKHGHFDTMEAGSNHHQFIKVHLSHDTSHYDHHNGEISDIDISPIGVLKSAKVRIFALALITFILLLVMRSTSQQLILSRRKNKLVFYKRYILSPPLRAPPQHRSLVKAKG